MPRRSSQLLDLARRGAEHRFEQLKAEIADLVKHFPHLARTRGRVAVDQSAEPAALIDRKPRPRRWTAAQRKAAAARMRKHWAGRKK
jgi:hypothetical protein